MCPQWFLYVMIRPHCDHDAPILSKFRQAFRWSEGLWRNTWLVWALPFMQNFLLVFHSLHFCEIPNTFYSEREFLSEKECSRRAAALKLRLTKGWNCLSWKRINCGDYAWVIGESIKKARYWLQSRRGEVFRTIHLSKTCKPVAYNMYFVWVCPRILMMQPYPSKTISSSTKLLLNL